MTESNQNKASAAERLLRDPKFAPMLEVMQAEQLAAFLEQFERTFALQERLNLPPTLATERSNVFEENPQEERGA